jgi:hypothetical protein
MAGRKIPVSSLASQPYRVNRGIKMMTEIFKILTHRTRGTHQGILKTPNGK